MKIVFPSVGRFHITVRTILFNSFLLKAEQAIPMNPCTSLKITKSIINFKQFKREGLSGARVLTVTSDM